MKWARSLLRFYVNSSIHVALAVVALLLVTTKTLDITVSFELLTFVFFSTITGYNFVKYSGIAGLHHRSLTHRLKIIQIFSAFSAVGVLYFGWMIDRVLWLPILVCGVLTFLYVFPLSRKRTLRTLKGTKIFVIALVWTGVVVFLPLLESGEDSYWDGIMVSLQRFLWVVVLTLPFEIRDLTYDALDLATIPQRLGVKKAKYFGLFLLSGVSVLLFMRDMLTSEIMVMEGVGILLTGFFLIRSQQHQRTYYASFWVESVPILWWVIWTILY